MANEFERPVFEVVVGNGSKRHVRTAQTLQECSAIIGKYIEENNIGGIYGYGYEDEGFVYWKYDDEVVPMGKISYNGRFWPVGSRRVRSKNGIMEFGRR